MDSWCQQGRLLEKRRTNLSPHSTHTLLFLHSNEQKWQGNSALLNCDIGVLSWGTKLILYITWRVLAICVCEFWSCNVWHLSLHDIRTGSENGKEWEWIAWNRKEWNSVKTYSRSSLCLIVNVLITCFYD